MALIPCPSCGAKFDVTSFTPGKKLRCSKCKEVFAVPTAQVPAPASAATQESRPPSSTRRRPSEIARAAGGSRDAGSPPGEKKPTRSFRPPTKSVKVSPPDEETGGETAQPAPKGSSKARLLIALVVVAALGAGGFFAFHSGEEASAATETYEQHLASVKKSMAKHFVEGADLDSSMALWCVAHHDSHDEQHIKAAIDQKTKSKALTDAVLALYWRKRLAADTLDQHLDLAEWCDTCGLPFYKKKECERVLAQDANNDRAKKILAAVSATPGGGETEADPDAEFKEIQRRKEEDKKKLDAMPDEWHRLSYKHQIDLRDTMEKGFFVLEKTPWVVIVEPSDKYKPDDVAKEFSAALDGLWAVYKKEISDRLKIEHVDLKPLFVHVLSGKERYDALAAKAQQTNRPDGYLWPGWNGAPLEIWTYHADKMNKPYLWYMGARTLYNAATMAKGGSGYGPYWLDDGLARCFEAAARAGKDAIGTADPERVALLQAELKLDRPERKTLGFSTFATKELRAMNQELATVTGKETDAEKAALKHKGDVIQAEAQTMCAFLLTAEWRPKLEKYLDQELSGKGGMEAFTGAFGGAEALEEAWQKFLATAK